MEIVELVQKNMLDYSAAVNQSRAIPDARTGLKPIHRKILYEMNADKIKSSGYVVDTLETALWCFLTTNNYHDCVLKAVNLGSDTDTVACVAGSIAGLYYGEIPADWIEAIRNKKLAYNPEEEE